MAVPTRPTLALIAAVARNGAIGRGNELLLVDAVDQRHVADRPAAADFGLDLGESELAALMDAVRPHDCWIIADEIYGSLVYDGFVQRFLADDPENEHFFAGGKPGHAMFDIAAYVAARLAAAGVSRIAIGGQDTYAEEADYFSYRRACHRGENSYGRQISLIGLR